MYCDTDNPKVLKKNIRSVIFYIFLQNQVLFSNFETLEMPMGSPKAGSVVFLVLYKSDFQSFIGK